MGCESKENKCDALHNLYIGYSIHEKIYLPAYTEEAYPRA